NRGRQAASRDDWTTSYLGPAAAQPPPPPLVSSSRNVRSDSRNVGFAFVPHRTTVRRFWHLRTIIVPDAAACFSDGPRRGLRPSAGPNGATNGPAPGSAELVRRGPPA